MATTQTATANPYAQDAQKAKFRQTVSELYRKRKDPNYVKFALEQVGYDGSLVDQELSRMQAIESGQPVPIVQPSTAIDLTPEKRNNIQIENTDRQNLINNAAKYKELVDKYGFESTVANPEIAGQMSGLRAGLLSDIKKAETLGTLDKGLLDFADILLGSDPTGPMAPIRNIGGVNSKAISSKIDELIASSQAKIDANKGLLGETTQSATSQTAQSSQVEQAKQWLQANPNDPRAEKVKAKLLSLEGGVSASPSPEQAQQQGGDSAVGQFAVGVGKSVLSSLQGASDIGQEIFGGAAQKIVGGNKMERVALPESLTDPSNSTQKVGKFTGDVAQFFIPGTNGLKVAQVSKGTGLGTKLIASLSKAAPEIAGATAVSTAQEGDTENVFRNAAIFGILGALGSGISKVANIAGEKIPERLVNTAIKTPLDESRKAIMYKGKTLGQELVDRGISGTDKKILSTATKNINVAEDKLQTILSGSDGVIKRADIEKYLQKVISQKQGTPGLSGDVEKIQRVLSEFPEQVSLREANIIKRNLYSALSDTAFKLDASLGSQREAMKAIAKGIKTEIEKSTSDKFGTAVKDINKDLSVYGRTQEALIDKLARKEKNNIFGLGNIGTATAGAVAGGAPLAGGLVLAKEILGSTVSKTTLAKVLNKLKDIEAKKTAKVTKATIYKTLQEVLDEGN